MGLIGMSCKKYSIILITCFCRICVLGQTDDRDRLLEDYDRQFHLLDSLMQVPFDPHASEALFGTDDFSVGQLSVFHVAQGTRQDGTVGAERNAALEDLMNRKTEAEIVSVKGGTGLQFSGTYAYRSSADGTSGLDEEGNFSRFNHRFQSEISWNILHSSLVQAKQKVAACRIGLEQARVEHKSDRLSEYIDWLTARNEQTYRRAVECIYALRLKHLYLLEQTEQVLLEHQPAGSDRLLEIMNEIFVLEQKLSSSPSSVASVDGLAYNRMDTVRIQTDQLLEAVNAGNYGLVKLDLDHRLLGIKVKQASFLTSLDVSPFLKYSAYQVTGGRNKYTIDVGLTLRVPLSFEASRTRKMLKLEQKICEMNRVLSYQSLENEILQDVRNLSGCNGRLCQEYGRLLRIRRLLETRSDAYSRMEGIYSRPARIKEYTLYLACLEEILRLKYEQNTALIHLQGYLPDVAIGSLLEYLPVS